MLIIPFRIGFRKTWSDPDWLLALYTLDYCGDVLLLVDILLNFRTTSISNGIEINNPSEAGEGHLSSGSEAKN